MQVALVPAGLVEKAKGELPAETVLVVCDVDGSQAASAAAAVDSHRTAVFVGDLSLDDEWEAAEALGAEIFRVEPSEVFFFEG